MAAKSTTEAVDEEKKVPVSRKALQKKYESLFEFTMGILMEHPNNVAEYGANFFNDNIQHRQTKLTYDLTEETEAALIRSICNSLYHTQRRSAFITPCYEEIEEKDIVKVMVPKTESQYNKLREIIKSVFLFRHLSSEEINDILDAMEKREVKKGQTVLSKGNCSDYFYIIEKGEFEVLISSYYKDPLSVQTYKDGDTFGEISLINNKPLVASIIAKTKGTVWIIDQKTFRRIVVKYATLKREEYCDFIDSVPIFKSLKIHEKYKLADAFEQKFFKKGHMIIQQGDVADGMYFVSTGEVVLKLHKNEDDPGVVVCKIECGGYFGELALITDTVRSTSAYALTDVRLVFLEKEGFERLLGPCIDIMKRDIPSYTKLVEELLGPRASQHSVKSG